MNKINALLLSLTLVSGLSLVNVRYRAQQHFAQFNRAVGVQAELENHFRQLTIEKAQRSAGYTVRQLAQRDGLRSPSVSDMQIIAL